MISLCKASSLFLKLKRRRNYNPFESDQDLTYPLIHSFALIATRDSDPSADS